MQANPRNRGHWVLEEATASPAFHLVVRGTAWLHADGREPLELAAGDLALLLRGERHRIAAGPDLADRNAQRPEPDGGRVTELICGRIAFGGALIGDILADLPDVLVIGGDSMRLEGLARLLAAEAAGSAPGRQVAMDRISDLLFIAVLRHLMERGDITRGLLAALGDPRLSRALAAMYGDPAAAWTLASLAEQASMSRTAFAQLFRIRMGTTPLRWLTRLRMDKAEAMLGAGHRTVGSMAADVGYASEASFRRAFSRWRKRRAASARGVH